MVATLAAGLAGGLAMSWAIRLANAAAGVVVAKTGTSVASPAEITAALNAARARSHSGKILPRADLSARLAEWRGQGHKISFTNGCFDLLHPGHVSLLRQARAAGDRLIVGLNSDASVRRLKGPARPIQDADTRAVVLAALASVDAVVVFDEDTPAEVIAAIVPDVLVKGADYAVDQVVGGDIVTAAGGRVVLATLEDGFSTTNTVAKINGDPALILPFKYLERCPRWPLRSPSCVNPIRNMASPKTSRPAFAECSPTIPAPSPTMAPAPISSAAARSR